jgi:hypothetical protein
MNELGPALRAWGRAVDGLRRPVDVDSILAGMVPVPRRRVVRRRAPTLVLAVVVLLLAAVFVGVRQTRPTEVRVQVPATEAPVPGSVPPPMEPSDAPILGSQVSIDGTRVRWRLLPVGYCPTHTSYQCMPTDGPMFEVILDEWIDGGGGGMGTWQPADRAPLTWAPAGQARLVGDHYEYTVAAAYARADVALVRADVRLADGTIAFDEQTPAGGAAVFAVRPPLSILALHAYDTAGTEIGSI